MLIAFIIHFSREDSLFLTDTESVLFYMFNSNFIKGASNVIYVFFSIGTMSRFTNLLLSSYSLRILFTLFFSFLCVEVRWSESIEETIYETSIICSMFLWPLSYQNFFFNKINKINNIQQLASIFYTRYFNVPPPICIVDRNFEIYYDEDFLGIFNNENMKRIIFWHSKLRLSLKNLFPILP